MSFITHSIKTYAGQNGWGIRTTCELAIDTDSIQLQMFYTLETITIDSYTYQVEVLVDWETGQREVSILRTSDSPENTSV